jgi:Ring finger domain
MQSMVPSSSMLAGNNDECFIDRNTSNRSNRSAFCNYDNRCTTNTSTCNATNITTVSKLHPNIEGLIAELIFAVMLASAIVIGKMTCSRCHPETERSSRYRRHIVNSSSGVRKVATEVEYVRIESSLRNMYVLPHHPTFCPYQMNENDEMNIDNKIDLYSQNDIESNGGESSLEHGSDTTKSYHSTSSNELCTMSAYSIHSTDTDVTARDGKCSICLHRFKIGDIVSMSPNSSFYTCQHIFHHICIKEWLLDHNSCPFCREIYFRDDEETGLRNDNTTMINNVRQDNAMKPKVSLDDNANFLDDDDTITCYCIHHGMIQYEVSGSHNVRRNSSTFPVGNNDPNTSSNRVMLMISKPTANELATMRLHPLSSAQLLPFEEASLQRHETILIPNTNYLNINTNHNDH